MGSISFAAGINARPLDASIYQFTGGLQPQSVPYVIRNIINYRLFIFMQIVHADITFIDAIMDGITKRERNVCFVLLTRQYFIRERMKRKCSAWDYSEISVFHLLPLK